MFSFLSVEFALTFIAFFVIYWAFFAKPYIQNLILLIASYLIIYLMAGAVASLILLVFTASILFISTKIASSHNLINKRHWLVGGILAVIINLSFFKYYDFFRLSTTQVLQALGFDSSGMMANLLFPLGISYYSFQAISYLMSIYRFEKNKLRYPNAVNPKLSAVQLFGYLSFFATITSGPISRVNNTKGLHDIFGNPCGMHNQFTDQKPRQILMPTLAFALIVLALAKKWWLAGYLAENWVNPVFANPTGFHSLEVLMAIYGYTLQLFLDFSGYSDMVVGFGLLLGFRLPMNFNAPLIAHNIRDFWDRWHISLSTWIRDYIYIPLGGSRKGFIRTQVNLMIAMILSGIWHGSTLNFLFWGMLHGFAIALLNVGDRYFQKKYQQPFERNFLSKKSLWGKVLGTVVTVHFVALAFVFFRATTFDESMSIFGALLYNHTNMTWQNNPFYLWAILMVAWICYPFVKYRSQRIVALVKKLPEPAIYVGLFLAFMAVVILAPSGIPSFIYANF